VSPTRVVHVVVAGELGGAERMLTDLASRAEESGAVHAVALITPEARLSALMRDAGVRVHDRGPRDGDGPFAFLRTSLGAGDVRWVASVLAAERAHVAHLHTFGSHVVGTRAALRTGVRVLRTEHSTRAFEDATCWPFSRWSLARAHASVAVSEHVRRVAAARAPWMLPKSCVVANGVDIDRFAPAAAPVGGPFRFALVGRLEPRKGVDLAIEALARVPGAHLDVVGDGAARAGLARLAQERGVARRVTLHGHLEDTRAVVGRADAALCASRSEGLGIALLEAMSMGRPVVGFRVGGVPEIVEDGRTGWLATAGDVEALAARMREAVQVRDRLPEYGRAARRAVVERFSVRAMCAGYASEYARLVATASAPA